MGRHGRSLSFHDIDCEQASGILSDVLKEADAFLGGSSIGKGLKKAAMFYMSGRSVKNALHLSLPGAKDLSLHDDDQTPTEEAFYIVDLGVVVSQVYQCKFAEGIGGWNRQSCNPCSDIVSPHRQGGDSFHALSHFTPSSATQTLSLSK
jgi:hypothetical protein